MIKVAAHSRIEIDTPQGAPQALGNCGRENEGDTLKGMKPESERLNDAICNLDVANKGVEGNSTIQINKTYAFVLHKDGTPLMPMKIGKAKEMIRAGKARIIKVKPLTIRLVYETTKNVDELTLGIDSGAIWIGYSLINKKLKREYIRGTLEQEHVGNKSNPAKGRMDERRMYRRNRRNRLWHRKARFDNRKKRDGKLPPTVERKYNTHKHLISIISAIAPVVHLVIEVAKFDIQKIKNPIIEGTEYQQGDLYGYTNVKGFLMAREKGKCQLCNKLMLGCKTNLHHIIPRSKGGTDKPNNLALLHEDCHKRLHREHLENTLKRNKQYKEPTFISMINKLFWKDYPNMSVTYGNITFVNRCKFGIEKSHSNDAFVIAGGDNTYTRSIERNLAQKRRNDRQLQWNYIKKNNLHKFRRLRSGRKPYHSGDLLLIDGKWIECKGMQSNSVVIGFRKNNKGTNIAITVSQKKISKSYRRAGIYFK